MSVTVFSSSQENQSVGLHASSLLALRIEFNAQNAGCQSHSPKTAQSCHYIEMFDPFCSVCFLTLMKLCANCNHKD